VNIIVNILLWQLLNNYKLHLNHGVGTIHQKCSGCRVVSWSNDLLTVHLLCTHPVNWALNAPCSGCSHYSL